MPERKAFLLRWPTVLFEGFCSPGPVMLPEDDLFAEMALESPWDLTGLYQCTPLGARIVLELEPLPDRIVIEPKAILF